ncbi:MAG: hypothetical protein R3F19_11055 [Verrucomicrobiales bacterium]
MSEIRDRGDESRNLVGSDLRQRDGRLSVSHETIEVLPGALYED